MCKEKSVEEVISSYQRTIQNQTHRIAALHNEISWYQAQLRMIQYEKKQCKEALLLVKEAFNKVNDALLEGTWR